MEYKMGTGVLQLFTGFRVPKTRGPCLGIPIASVAAFWGRTSIWGLNIRPQQLPVLWFHIPCIIVVCGTSNGPQNVIGNYLGPCSTHESADHAIFS